MYTLPFESCDRDAHGRVGGKCASLGQMIAAGAPVPPGFAVTTSAYSAVLKHGEINTAIHNLLATIDYGDVDSEERASVAIRALIEGVPIPAEIEIEIRAAYARLCERCACPDVPVAVRSSATAEDLPGASFAGQQDTFLWVVGTDAVLEHVRKCWSSLYTGRAIAYRHDKGFEHERVLMAVAVQQMCNARVAGVAMTLNPINGDRSKVVIDASWGLGESVVGGTVTPDNFHVDKVIHEITQRKISTKGTEIVPDVANRCVVHHDVDAARQNEPSLTDAEVIAIAKMARGLEKHYGGPQDIEWALDGDRIVLLQCRPETVWSQKKAGTAPTATGVAGVLGTLLSPMKVKKD
jgi:pyruvate, water dikinase